MSGSEDEPGQQRYDIVLAHSARRALQEELPEAVAIAAWETIDGPLRERPRVIGHPLRAPYAGMWRATRGEYRIRYKIDDRRRTVTIFDVDHRRDAYHR